MSGLWNNEAYQSELKEVNIPETIWEKLYGKTILVTGATGMVCSFLVDVIIKRNSVLSEENKIKLICLVRNLKAARERFFLQLELDNLILEEADIGESLERIKKYNFDYIIAGAGNADPASFSNYPVDTMKSNFFGAYHLLELAREQENCRFLYISTGEVYGNAETDIDFFSEEDSYYVNPTDFRSCYPNSKRAAETLCVSYMKQYGIDAVIGRLCYIYGPTIKDSDSRSVAQFLRCAANGENIVLKSTGEQVRSYCYVADVAAALLYLLVLGKSGEAYNVADIKSNCSIAEFAGLIAKLANVQCVYLKASEREKEGYSRVMRAIQSPAKICDLGWKAKTELLSGIKRTLGILGR